MSEEQIDFVGFEEGIVKNDSVKVTKSETHIECHEFSVWSIDDIFDEDFEPGLYKITLEKVSK